MYMRSVVALNCVAHVRRRVKANALAVCYRGDCAQVINSLAFVCCVSFLSALSMALARMTLFDLLKKVAPTEADE